jgi:hypothetical protein
VGRFCPYPTIQECRIQAVVDSPTPMWRGTILLEYYKLYICTHQIKLVSHFSWQFIIFNLIVKLVKDFWPILYFPDPS